MGLSEKQINFLNQKYAELILTQCGSKAKEDGFNCPLIAAKYLGQPNMFCRRCSHKLF